MRTAEGVVYRSEGVNPPCITRKAAEIAFERTEASETNEALKRATSRQDKYVAAQVKAAADRAGSAMLGGNGDPGSSNRGGVSAGGRDDTSARPMPSETTTPETTDDHAKDGR